jgi:hypothetical protein
MDYGGMGLGWEFYFIILERTNHYLAFIFLLSTFTTLRALYAFIVA